MSQYKELADALDNFDEDCKQRDEIAAILLGLDAQRPTVDEVLALVVEYGTHCSNSGQYAATFDKRMERNSDNEAKETFAKLRNAIEALAATVAAPQSLDAQHVATVAEVHMSRYTLEWNGSPQPEGTKLYAAPVAAQPQQAKPEPKRKTGRVTGADPYGY